MSPVFGLNQLHIERVSRCNPRSVIGRTIVDNDDFVRRNGLRCNAVKCFMQRVSSIPRRNNGTEFHALEPHHIRKRCQRF